MAGNSNRYRGLWQRLLLARPHEPVETLVRADWLQGPTLFADLRQPPAISGRVQASCLSEVQPEDARIMACQEGFAGRLIVIGNGAEWCREIDFQAPAAARDRGRLVYEQGLLIEHGIEAEYVEYWQGQADGHGGHSACAAAAFVSERDGRNVILVQHDRHFAYARDRGTVLPLGSDLSALLCDTDARQAQALVDCEISFGTVTGEGWRIDRSTLPWREGALLLEPATRIAAGRLTIGDIDPLGLPLARELRLMDLHGTFAFAPEPRPAALARPAQAESGSFRTIPVIDVTALGGDDPAAEAAAVAQLRIAASEVGFLHITGHGIAPAVIERLQGASKRFFALTEKQKMASYIGHSANHRGYVPRGEEVFGDTAEGASLDLKETFDLALDLPAERTPAGHPMLGPNQWPALPGFREDVMAYYAAAFAVGRRLLRGLCLALGQPADTLDHCVLAPPSQLRLIHYPFQPQAQDAAGIGAHTDYECFTLLLATAPGLEVMNPVGDWIDAPPVPGGLVVNIGDLMEFWSGGQFVATSHRVRKVAEERYSFPLFFALDYDVELAPIGRPAGDHHIRTGEHLWTNTIRTFRYLQARADRGEICVPEGAPPPAAFGQDARHRNANPA